MPDGRLEGRLARQWGGPVAGLDEAGRGPWAGPVVAAAVVLTHRRLPRILRDGLDDSKKLTAQRREELHAAITESGACAWGVAVADVAEIDRHNILAATVLAMSRALAALPDQPSGLLVDGNYRPRLGLPVEPVVGGDGICLAIAAASILAKVTRDRMMLDLAAAHPGYRWESNKGYGTADHRDALLRLGPCAQHRRSFAPIRAMLERGQMDTADADLFPDGATN